MGQGAVIKHDKRAIVKRVVIAEAMTTVLVVWLGRRPCCIILKKLSQLYPQISLWIIKLVVHASKAERYELSIHDMKGNRIAILGSGELQANKSNVHPLQINRFARGTYVVKLVTDSEVLIGKVVIQ